MAINLLALKPHKVSTDLSSSLIFLYGCGGCGKTTFGASMNKPLLLAFEKGYNAIPGVIAQDITTWGEMKSVVRELKKPEVKETFSTVVVDTIDIASDLCEKYICNREGVEKISELAWGSGFKMVRKELEDTFRAISQLNYAIIFISHAKDKVFKREDGSEYNQIVPSLSPSINEVIRNMCDIQAYIDIIKDESGKSRRVMTLRSPDGSVECKSRYAKMAAQIPLSTEALMEAVEDAIRLESEENGSGDDFITEERNSPTTETTIYDFADLMNQFKEITTALQKNVSKEDFKGVWAPKIKSLTDKYLGKGKKVNECTEQQAEQLSLIVDELTELVGQGI